MHLIIAEFLLMLKDASFYFSECSEIAVNVVLAKPFCLLAQNIPSKWESAHAGCSESQDQQSHPFASVVHFWGHIGQKLYPSPCQRTCQSQRAFLLPSFSPNPAQVLRLPSWHRQRRKLHMPRFLFQHVQKQTSSRQYGAIPIRHSSQKKHCRWSSR